MNQARRFRRKNAILATVLSLRHVQRKHRPMLAPSVTERGILLSRRSFAQVALGLLVLSSGGRILGDENNSGELSPVPDDSSELFRYTPPESFQNWLTDRAREQLPEAYEKAPGWGNTTRVLSGWKLERDGIKVETRRRYREVNHGTWKRYRVVPLAPDQNVIARVLEIRQLDEVRYALDLMCHAKLDIEGRVAQWSHGVQLISLSADAVADVTMFATLEVRISVNPTVFPPTLSADLKATSADLVIDRFRLKKISKLDGPLVRSLSDETQELIEEAIAKKREKLLASLNRAIEKNKDKLKLNTSDLLSLRSSAVPLEKTMR